MGLVSTVAIDAANGQTYYVDQPQFYSSGDCGQSDAGADMTGQLLQAMAADGWTGSFFTGSNAWPQDFGDPNRIAGGLDYLYADNKQLAVFAGHGQTKRLYFSHQHNGACIEQANATAFGPGTTGGVARNLMLYACCAMNLCHAHSWVDYSRRLIQVFGFHAPAQPDAAAVTEFYNDSSSVGNKVSWLANMKYPNNYLVPNQPVVATNENSTYLYYQWNVSGCSLKNKVCISSGITPEPYDVTIYHAWLEPDSCGGCFECDCQP